MIKYQNYNRKEFNINDSKLQQIKRNYNNRKK